MSLLSAFAALLSLVTVGAAAAASRDLLPQWQRSMLVYNYPDRTPQQWQRHLMRVGEDGNFTGQWLFDAAILTDQFFHDKDLMYAQFTGDELGELLDQTFADAASLDSAVTELAKTHGAPPAPIQVSITMPWLNPDNHSLRLPGSSTTLDLGDADQRVQAADWYLDQIKSRAGAAGWQHLALYGAYYHREEIIDPKGDPAFVQRFNADAHGRGLKTVWVPFYEAPHAFEAAQLGFDVSNMQPSQAFRSPQYGGEANDGRLYAVGSESVKLNQAYEYEASSGGESQLENWSAHQYLAVAQEKGVDKFPQVFFTGLTADMFDKITTKEAATGDRWWCYSDLADYLDGKHIANLEIGLPWPVKEQQDGTRLVEWTPPEPLDLWAVRMDFTTPDPDHRWRGRLTVKVDGPGGTRTSFRQDSGTTDFPPYYQVRAPLALSADGDSKVSKLTIILSREAGTDWPAITRLVADRFVVPVTANGIAGELATSSNPVQPGTHPDSAPTHLGFSQGKLTDGFTSPTGDWNWNGAVGWNFYGSWFTITIDLGQEHTISQVDMITHYDQTAGIGWPEHPFSYIGRDTPARHAGIEGLTEKAAGTSRVHTLTKNAVSGAPSQMSGTWSMAVPDIDGRYVTIHSHGAGWILLDEILVKDETGAVVSNCRPYTVSPVPSVEQGQQTPYGDNAQRLTNQVIAPVFAPQFSYLVDGIRSDTGGSVESTWVGARPVRTVTVWFTRPSQKDGVILPPMPPTGKWRDQNGNWIGIEAKNIEFRDDGASPHVTMILPYDAQLTGARMEMAPTPGTNGWYMISEITAR